jgi:hypothetical protein
VSEPTGLCLWVCVREDLRVAHLCWLIKKFPETQISRNFLDNQWD